VFIGEQSVFRAVTPAGLDDWTAVGDSSFFAELVDEGKVIDTEPCPTDVLPPGQEWAACLRHRRIPVVNHPYEWSVTMLRDAALLQLEVTRRAVLEGFITKDATSFNVVFDGARPVFIDVGSFERLRPGEPWPGYRQFCELFLNPLVLQTMVGVPFQPWLRGAPDGIAPSELAPMLKGRHKLNRRLMVHVGLHARAERRFADADTDHDVRSDLRRAGFGPKVLLAQLDNLERTVRSLEQHESGSTWSDYSDRSHYDDADLATKETAVGDAVSQLRPTTVLDLGANDGRFSQLAVDRGAGRAVAVDSDHLVVDRLYRKLRDQDERRILPLVMDLTNPSPGLGWRSRERAPFTARVRPDLVLCLAVVHHLAITDNVPFDMVVDFLADFAAPVVVEFPSREDPMAARLLARKRAGLFGHYDTAGWEAALSRRFDIGERTELPSGRRVLYRAVPR
jgi:hypothetical protein